MVFFLVFCFEQVSPRPLFHKNVDEYVAFMTHRLNIVRGKGGGTRRSYIDNKKSRQSQEFCQRLTMLTWSNPEQVIPDERIFLASSIGIFSLCTSQ